MTAPLDALRSEDGWLKASSDEGRFGSLFGRDSLIAALQLLPVDPSIADATLSALGAALGTVDDPEREEEPGKVPHEVRARDLDEYVAHGWPVRDGELRYYGSVDASCWWLIVFGALARHGGSVRHHRAAAGRVAAWLAGRPTPLTYERRARSGGLAHHWWRDVAADLVDVSSHGMFADDGSPMRGPVASTAVQALAWRALSEAAVFVDPALDGAADAARAAFGRLPAFARHAGGDASAATSDLGVVLWSGVAGGAPDLVAPLLGEELRTPFGLRTLPVAHPAFRVDGYHSGAVWPWDSWIGAGGINASEPGAGDPLLAGIVEAVTALGGHPELYGVDLDGRLTPSSDSCAVQAWTYGAVAAIGRGWDGRAWAQ